MTLLRRLLPGGKAIGMCMLLHLSTACNSEEKSIFPPDLHLEDGDLVFRQGRTFDSHAIMIADRKSSYSHIGIVVDSAGLPMVIHAVPNEPDFFGDSDRIKMDTPQEFFLESRATIGEVMRIHQKAIAQRAAQKAISLYKKQIPFDHDYNDKDSTKMYCTELVLYVYRSSGINLATGEHENISFPIHFQGFLPSAVHESPYLESVRTF